MRFLKYHKVSLIIFPRLSGLRPLLTVLNRPMSTHMERTESSFRDDDIYSAEVIKVNKLSTTVKSLKLKVTDKLFGFKPGQWVDFIIPGLSVVGGFSICSSPKDLKSDSSIELAVKYSDHPPAKWVHNQCEVGNKVQIRVGGNFYLHLPHSTDAKRDLLFIAGGVGINPLWSMLKCAAENSSCFGQTALLFSAATMDELLFKNEIISVQKQHPHFKCSFFVSQESEENLDHWTQGRRITKETIKATTAQLNVSNMSVDICGPQPMIQFVCDSLVDLEVSIEQIHFEKWW